MKLIQGSPAWLEWRNTKIGASDAPIIMGASPYKTQYRLWQEKLFLVEPQFKSESMALGNELEPMIRDRFEEQTNIMVMPTCLTHPRIQWMICSLDGISLDEDVFIEIKLNNKDSHQKAKNGIIRKDHDIQMQHQWMCTHKAKKAFYVSYHKSSDDLVIVESFKDKYIQDEIFAAEEDFWNCLKNKVSPEMTEADRHWA